MLRVFGYRVVGCTSVHKRRISQGLITGECQTETVVPRARLHGKGGLFLHSG